MVVHGLSLALDLGIPFLQTRRTARSDGTGRYWVNAFTRWPPVAQVYSIEKELGRREEDGVTWS